jgi:diguanylate cyclase (GGDEF)-like protein/PAS domain S-box-containing protein
MVRLSLRAGGELVGNLLLFDLPNMDRVAETIQIVHLLSSPIALALKNSLAHSEIEQLALELEERVEERSAELQNKCSELLHSEERFRRAIEEAPFPIMIHAENGEVLALSRAWIEITGYSLAEIPTTSQWTEKAYRERKNSAMEEIETLYSLELRKQQGEYLVHCKDGNQRIWEFSSVSLGRLPDGRRMAMSMASDVTERKQTEDKLASSERRFRTILQTALDGFWIVNPERRILEANEAYCQMSGYSQQELCGMRIAELDTQDSDVDTTILANKAREQGRLRYESIHRRKDGSLFYVDVSITYLPLEGGHFAVFLHDITERKRAEQQIQELAYFDGLTKLPNRRLMMDRLRHAIIANSRSRRNGALLFIDLDHFKILNDTYGHAEGDLLLQQAAHRFTASVREGDTVARLGGDEFIVILEDLSESSLEAADQIKQIGHKILDSLRQPFTLSGRQYLSSGSIGAVMFRDAPDSLDDLLKLADIAMYQAKTAGRNTLCFNDPVVQAAVKARALMEEDLRLAIARNELQLYYQPQICQGSLTGAEALIRWISPKRGMVMPDEFISLAEETNLILDVGNWVLETACAQIVDWAKRPETRELIVAINVSARQFHQPDFVERVLGALDSSGADPGRLKLELTESMLLDNVENVIAKMNQLKQKGLCFSLDDFGTGYSSLAYLSRLPMDQLKIDKSFVQNLLADPHCGAIAQTIIALGQTLGLSVIAEGVEAEEQLEFLERMGCKSFQGYLFGKPLSIMDFERLLSPEYS